MRNCAAEIGTDAKCVTSLTAALTNADAACNILI